jgi:hypothetical protein
MTKDAENAHTTSFTPTSKMGLKMISTIPKLKQLDGSQHKPRILRLQLVP